MTVRRLTLGLVLALAAPVAPALAGPSEVQDSFEQGVDLLRRGRKDEALRAFQEALASNPSSEEAFELWQSVERDIWLEMLVEQGEFELIAKRFLDLAKTGHAERRNDPDRIRELVGQVLSDDVDARLQATRQLAGDHGEYAVPQLVRVLGQTGDEDRLVLAMHALSRMSSNVVPPLIEALDSEDSTQRRNVALTLGNIGDPRAGGMLTWLAENDEDSAVRAAASEAAADVGAGGSALEHFLRNGEDYHYQRDSVLRDFDYSDVVWEWRDGGLEALPVPRYLYNDEMAKKSYYRALMADASSREALAGLARAAVDERFKVEQRQRAGQDVGGLLEQARRGVLTASAAGVEPLDLALRWSVQNDDAASGVQLARMLGDVAGSPTSGLTAGLSSGDGAIRGEAALALARIASRTGGSVSGQAVRVLGEAAGRELMRIAFVIDGDAARMGDLRAGLANQNVFVTGADTGAAGLALLRRVPGVDVILVAGQLPDLTVQQVLSEIRADWRTEETPVLIVSRDRETAEELYGDQVAGIVSSAEDLGAVDEALQGGLNEDRARADDLAQRSAEVLARLAAAGNTDVSPALEPLASAATSGRSDAVAVPAMNALAAGGTPAQAPALLGVLVDGERSDESRTAAAGALIGILGRNPMPIAQEGLDALREVIVSEDASIELRDAAARVLGLVQVDPQVRQQILREVRVNVTEAAE